MAIYMKYDGIKGAVTEAGHKEWIELESCQLGCNRSISNRSGAGQNREASAVSVSEMTVTKLRDCASTELFQEALFGKGKKVEIHFCKTDGGKLETYLKYELDSVLVSSYSLSGHGDGQPHESLSLNFQKVTMTTIEMDKDNNAGKPKFATYDAAKVTNK